MRNLNIFIFFVLLELNLVLITFGKFMIKSKKEVLTQNNLDKVYQTKLQHEMVFIKEKKIIIFLGCFLRPRVCF